MSAKPFLGIQVEENWPSDVKYAISMLQAKDPATFFKGLKIISAIHAFNDVQEKRDIAERFLKILCKILPSYIRKVGEQYHYNITKINESIAQGKNPLDLSISTSTSEQVQGLKVVSLPTGTKFDHEVEGSGDTIRVISIEGPDDEKGSVSNGLNGSKEALHPASIESEDESISLNEEIQEEDAFTNLEQETTLESDKTSDISEFVDEATGIATDEWLDASLFQTSINEKYLFDNDKSISKELEEGLSLINPMEHQEMIDLQVSRSRGYQSPYTNNAAPAQSYQELPSNRPVTVKKVPAVEYEGERCIMDDGSFTADDGNILQCLGCGALFHRGCFKLVLDFQGGTCPSCGKLLILG